MEKIETARLCLTLASNEEMVSSVEAEAEESNAASLRVLEKCGFMANGKHGAEGPRFVLSKSRRIAPPISSTWRY